MSFGKRPSSTATRPAAQPPSAPPPPPSGDPHYRRKVIPDEAWQGKTGAMLRDLGFSPNDENNLVPNAASINAQLEEGKRRIDERLAKANANARSVLPSAELRPFFLIPDPVWNSEAGTFLMTSLSLYPYDDWNVVFLAADQRTAVVMDIALHPNGNVTAFVATAEKFMADAREYVKRAMDEAELTSDFAAFQEKREDAQLRIKSLAMSFARTIIETWEKQKNPDYVSPFVSDSPPPPLPMPARAASTEPTGLDAVVDEIRDEAEKEVKNAAFGAARSAFNAFMRRDG